MLAKLSILSKLIPYLKKYWKLIFIAIVIIGGIWHYRGLVNENEELRSQVQEAESTIEDFREQEQEFIDTINEYNEKTEELEAKTDELRERAKQSREQRRQAENELNQTLRELDQIEIGESCEDSMDFLRDRAIERNKNNENE